MFTTYIIKFLTFDIYYIGQTNNPPNRLARHNQNRDKYSKGKGQQELVYSCNFKTRREAVQLEQKLKSYKNKQSLQV